MRSDVDTAEADTLGRPIAVVSEYARREADVRQMRAKLAAADMLSDEASAVMAELLIHNAAAYEHAESLKAAQADVSRCAKDLLRLLAEK